MPVLVHGVLVNLHLRVFFCWRILCRHIEVRDDVYVLESDCDWYTLQRALDDDRFTEVDLSGHTVTVTSGEGLKITRPLELRNGTIQGTGVVVTASGVALGQLRVLNAGTYLYLVRVSVCVRLRIYVFVYVHLSFV